MSEPKTLQIAFRSPQEVVNRIDAYAEMLEGEIQIRVSRTMALERLVNIGLASELSRMKKK